MNQIAQIDQLACDVVDALKRSNRQLVLAESCTSGLVAALLGGVPGVSKHFCGSAVVYQETTKSSWLGVCSSELARYGAVSSEVAASMVQGVLTETPHADIAAAITGHLGPDSPRNLDGTVFVAVQRRGQQPSVTRYHLDSPAADPGDSGLSDRKKRQFAAAGVMLTQILASLTDNSLRDDS